MKVSGYQIEDSIDSDGNKLLLCGAGLRRKFLLNIYIASFYIEDLNVSNLDALYGKHVKLIRMQLLLSVGSGSLISKTLKENTKRYGIHHEPEIISLINNIEPVLEKETASKNDCFDFVLNKKGAFCVYKNDKKLYEVKNGQTVAILILGIWLKPENNHALRKELLHFNLQS